MGNADDVVDADVLTSDDSNGDNETGPRVQHDGKSTSGGVTDGVRQVDSRIAGTVLMMHNCTDSEMT